MAESVIDVSEWAQTVEDSLTTSSKLLIGFLPKLFGAFMLLVLGIVIGRLVSAATSRILQFIGFDRLLNRTALQTVLERSGTKKPGSQILGAVMFWVIFLLFLISATETLGLAILSEALTGLAFFIPKVGVAMVIIVLGMMAANFLREIINLACSSAGIAQGTVVAQAFYVAATLLVIVTAINELGIDTTLLNYTIVLLAAGLVAGAALSFGLGARNAVANLIAAHYLHPILRVGQKVQVGTVSGEVATITPVSVVLDTAEGRVVIPASQFSETSAIISSPEP